MLTNLKIKSPVFRFWKIVYAIVVCAIVGFLGLAFTGIFKEDLQPAQEVYVTESDVEQSKAYQHTLWALSELEDEENISSIQSITWMYSQANTAIDKRDTAHLKIVYNADTEKTAYFSITMTRRRPGSVSMREEVNVVRLTKLGYNQKKALWLAEIDDEKAAWLKEREYDEFALSVIYRELKGER